jgi:hypothetical protein
MVRSLIALINEDYNYNFIIHLTIFFCVVVDLYKNLKVPKFFKPYVATLLAHQRVRPRVIKEGSKD